MDKKLIPRRIFVNPMYKDKVTVLKTSEETNGAYSLGLLEVWPGGGNPMHTHSAFEETFTAQTGVLGVNLKGQRHLLHPGESITVPKYAAHHFFNASDDPITCTVKLVPGNDDFLKGIAIAYGLASDNLTTKTGMPKSLKNLAMVIALTNTKPTGIFGLIYPLFKSLANRARRDGTEQNLLEKYYYVSEKAL